ncbi:MAG: hypothetical protein QXR48_00445 [Candidatus Woesearchaeota archaeon]
MKKLLAVVLALLIVILIILGIRWVMMPKRHVYSNNPADWLSPVPGGVSVDVKEATRGKGKYNDVNEQVLIPGMGFTAFAYEGIYKGNFFGTKYFDENGKLMMEVTPILNPNDGILQGFMVERSMNGVLETHIFIDEDWRRAVGNDLRIVWGSDYSKSRPFVFNQVRQGVYHDFVQDDSSRLGSDGSLGGVQVGNIQPGGVDPAQASNIIMMAIH